MSKSLGNVHIMLAIELIYNGFDYVCKPWPNIAKIELGLGNIYFLFSYFPLLIMRVNAISIKAQLL